MSDEIKAKSQMDQGWHLDRRVPIALIIALLVQTSAAIWWASDINARIHYIERDMNGVRGAQDRLSRLEAEVSAMRRTLDKIDQKLDRFTSR